MRNNTVWNENILSETYILMLVDQSESVIVAHHLIVFYLLVLYYLQVLFNYEWLHTKLTAMSIHDLLSDFNNTLSGEQRQNGDDNLEVQVRDRQTDRQTDRSMDRQING